MKKIGHIANLVNAINSAIKSGDWIVDGACDPDCYISMAEARLEQEGWNNFGGELVRDDEESDMFAV